MTMQCSISKSRSLVLVLAVAAVAAGCSGAAVEETPGNTPGGMMPMGTNPGNTTPGSMNPSTPGSSGGQASLKFCNAVGTAGGALEMELEMGSVKLKAASGACSPCSSVQGGTARLVFKMGGKEVFAQDVGIEGGQQYVVISTVDRATQKIGLGGGKLRSGATCANENPFPAGNTPGGSAPGPVATAGKFCHRLSRQGGVAVDFELKVGNVTMMATTGGCSSPSGSMCQALPEGATTASLSIEGEEIATAPVTIEKGKEYLFGLTIDAAGAPSITSQALAAGMSCATAGPPTGGAPPPGTNPPPSGMAEIKVCNRLPVMGNRNVAELDIGGLHTITTKPGECAPMKGMACKMVPAAATTLALTLDGVDVGEADANLPSGGIVLNLVSDAAGMPGIRVTPVPAGMMCSAFEPM